MNEEENAREGFKREPESLKEGFATIKKEVEEVKRQAQSVAEKLNDPVFLAATMNALVHEKESNNRVLKNIYAELERLKHLEERIASLENRLGKATNPTGDANIIPEVDAQILQVIKQLGKACAEDVRKRLKYRGRNAASARLHRLYQQGYLVKKQAGRTVWYISRS